jgi:signal transduction histidine kinase
MSMSEQTDNAVTGGSNEPDGARPVAGTVRQIPNSLERAIASSLDVPTTLANIVRAATATLCDGCAVYEQLTAGAVQRVAVAGASAEHDSRMHRLSGLLPGSAAARALRERLAQAEAAPLELDGASLERDLRVWDPALFRELAVTAALVFPLKAGDAAYALAFYRLSPGASFSASEVERAAVLAAWSAAALDRACEHRATQIQLGRLEHLLSVLSHDLGNPLTALRIAVSMVLRMRGDSRPDEITQYLDHMNDSVDQMKRLVEEVRDLQRLQAGRMTMLYENDAPAMLLGQILDMLSADAETLGVRVVTDTMPNVPLVRVDRRRTVQALTILVERALSVTAPGGTVELRILAGGDDVIFSITDMGHAAAPAPAADLFQRFWSERLEQGGHEALLRLALAHGMITAQRGSLRALPNENGGLTIHCALPRAPEPPPAK